MNYLGMQKYQKVLQIGKYLKSNYSGKIMTWVLLAYTCRVLQGQNDPVY